MMNYLTIFLDYVGRYGPSILFLFSVILLWNKTNYLTYYVYGFILNALLTLILKGIIKQPRPSEDPKEFNLAIKNGHRFIFKNGIPYDIFGMPSGHSNSALFTSVFVFLSLKDFKILSGFLIMSLLIMSQRVVDNRHTVFQVIVGASIGALCAYLFYYFSQSKLKGKIEEKPDDNGPL